MSKKQSIREDKTNPFKTASGILSFAVFLSLCLINYDKWIGPIYGLLSLATIWAVLSENPLKFSIGAKGVTLDLKNLPPNIANESQELPEVKIEK